MMRNMSIGYKQVRHTQTVDSNNNAIVDAVKASMVPLTKAVEIVENNSRINLKITRIGYGIINTPFGRFYQFDFRINDKWKKYSVILNAEIDGTANPVFKDKSIIVRIDSGCETGQLFGDHTCECREQLQLVMQKIKKAGEGIIVHIPSQDGRGMGLSFKLATLSLQDELGVDTVESATMLAGDGPIDVRTYGGVIGILKFFGITSSYKIDLATNNPKKANIFKENGYILSGYMPIVVPPTIHTEHHLLAKQNHLGHLGLVDLHRSETEGYQPRNFTRLLNSAVVQHKSLVCCGLDPDMSKMPKEVTESSESDEMKIFKFLREVIELTAHHVSVYKLQKAFFDILPNGKNLLKEVINYIHAEHEDIPVIVDCKIGDIENTMRTYIDLLFKDIGADAIVVNPYMGDEVLLPFRDLKEKAAVVLVRTSGSGSDIIQNIITSDGKRLWMTILDLIVERASQNRNLMPVISTAGDVDFKYVREKVPVDMTVFLAGFGAQGGSLDKLPEILNSDGNGAIINSSRGILYPYSPENRSWRIAIENSVIRMKDHINSRRGLK